jgi:hypothetical protein
VAEEVSQATTKQEIQDVRAKGYHPSGNPAVVGKAGRTTYRFTARCLAVSLQMQWEISRLRAWPA